MKKLVNTLLDDIASLIGFTATVRLSSLYGGQTLYIPEKVTTSNPIVDLIGEQAARKLIAEFGNETLYIPCPSEFVYWSGAALGFQLYRRGMALTEIAAQLSVSIPQARHMIKEARLLRARHRRPSTKRVGGSDRLRRRLAAVVDQSVYPVVQASLFDDKGKVIDTHRVSAGAGQDDCDDHDRAAGDTDRHDFESSCHREVDDDRLDRSVDAQSAKDRKGSKGNSNQVATSAGKYVFAPLGGAGGVK